LLKNKDVEIMSNWPSVRRHTPNNNNNNDTILSSTQPYEKDINQLRSKHA